MPEVIRSDHAEIDLLEIWLYIADRSFSSANRLLTRFEAQIRMLAEHPGFGERRDELASGLRSWPVGNYLIFYTLTSKGIIIQRVLHGARDVRREFR